MARHLKMSPMGFCWTWKRLQWKKHILLLPAACRPLKVLFKSRCHPALPPAAARAPHAFINRLFHNFSLTPNLSTPKLPCLLCQLISTALTSAVNFFFFFFMAFLTCLQVCTFLVCRSYTCTLYSALVVSQIAVVSKRGRLFADFNQNSFSPLFPLY